VRVALMCSFLLIGCVDTLQDVARPPGQMNPSGTINPCHGYESDKQLCGDSKLFAGVINRITLGQTREEVRTLMMRDPWRRELKENEERWGYSTDYSDERMTWIGFRDGKVVSVTGSQWDDSDEED